MIKTRPFAKSSFAATPNQPVYIKGRCQSTDFSITLSSTEALLSAQATQSPLLLSSLSRYDFFHANPKPLRQCFPLFPLCFLKFAAPPFAFLYPDPPARSGSSPCSSYRPFRFPFRWPSFSRICCGRKSLHCRCIPFRCHDISSKKLFLQL
jgi:hypothetical protein